MSQALTPIANSDGEYGSLQTIATQTSGLTTAVLSPQYKAAKELVVGETEWWVPGGRPIYRRLPAVGEAYQTFFFADGEIGYCYIPPGRNQFGAGSLFVSSNEEKSVLLIYDGTIVWETGTTKVLKTVVDLANIGVESGRWIVAYQRIYNDDPQPFAYEVTDFSLAGIDMEVDDSASAAFRIAELPNGNPWPYPGRFAFFNQDPLLNWKNYTQIENSNPISAVGGVTPGFPDWLMPVNGWIQWFSTKFEGAPLLWKLDDIVLRSPQKFRTPPSATLYFATSDPETPWAFVQSQDAKLDSEGWYWEFQTDADAQFGWRVEWSDNRIEISSVTVSGNISLLKKPSTPVTRAQLAMYPEYRVPEDAVLCRLALINVDRGRLVKSEDIRNIATRDFEPIADWLTEFADEMLIENFAKVKAYAPDFMAPPILLRGSYFDLEEYDITVDSTDGPCPPKPPVPTDPPILIRAEVSVYPSLDAKLIGAEVFVTPPPGIVLISGIELKILP